ncbi:MAG: hypothetical protein AAF740_09975 [Bacteroidota bacterium]
MYKFILSSLYFLSFACISLAQDLEVSLRLAPAFPASQFEDAGALFIPEFTLSAAQSTNTRIYFQLSGTARTPEDYTVNNASTITNLQLLNAEDQIYSADIPAGQTSGAIGIFVSADTLAEPNETVTIEILEDKERYFSGLLRDSITTGILLDYGFEFIDTEDFNGTLSDSTKLCQHLLFPPA